MSQVQNNTYKRPVIEGRPRQVISTTPIEWEAIKFTDSAGNVDVCIALVFGTDPTTGEEQLAVINPEDLKQLLKVPDTHIRDGVLKARKLRKCAPAELPEGNKLGSFELEGIA